MKIGNRESTESMFVSRRLFYRSNRSYTTYRTYFYFLVSVFQVSDP
jgi:hypothetical protein